MRQLRLSAIELIAFAGACGDDNIPLGIEDVGPQAPSAPGPRGPSGSGPGRLGTGSSSDIASVVVAPSSLTLQVGDSVQVVAAALSQTGQGVTSATFTWTSSDPRIVRVREDPAQRGVAVVTGVGVGTATVSVAAGNASATAVVAVTPRR